MQRWESKNGKNFCLCQERIAKLAEILNVSPSILIDWITELKLDRIDNQDVEAILAIYKKHKQKNQGHKYVVAE